MWKCKLSLCEFPLVQKLKSLIIKISFGFCCCTFKIMSSYLSLWISQLKEEDSQGLRCLNSEAKHNRAPNLLTHAASSGTSATCPLSVWPSAKPGDTSAWSCHPVHPVAPLQRDPEATATSNSAGESPEPVPRFGCFLFVFSFSFHLLPSVNSFSRFNNRIHFHSPLGLFSSPWERHQQLLPNLTV